MTAGDGCGVFFLFPFYAPPPTPFEFLRPRRSCLLRTRNDAVLRFINEQIKSIFSHRRSHTHTRTHPNTAAGAPDRVIVFMPFFILECRSEEKRKEPYRGERLEKRKTHGVFNACEKASSGGLPTRRTVPFVCWCWHIPT